MAGFIEWIPAAECPDSLKDGRRCFVWMPYDDPDERPSVGWWESGPRNDWVKKAGFTEDGCWRHEGDDGTWDIQPTHIAEINAPNWVPPGFIRPKVMGEE